MLDIQLFGGFSLRYQTTTLTLPARDSRSLLAYLATYAGQAHTRSRLAGLFWPDLNERAARRRLSHALWQINSVLPAPQGHSYLLRSAETVQFNQQLAHTIDVAEFELDWQHARQAGVSEEARFALRRMATRYTGDFLAGYYDDWMLLEQERLREIYLRSLHQLIALEKGAKDYNRALQACLSVLAIDPLQETAYQEGIRLYLAMGRPQDAARLFARCQETLASELGVEPSATTRGLADSIATHQEQPSSIESQGGLAGDDELPLVGRSRERSWLLQHLGAAMSGQGGIVLVEGETGIGKSRLLRALAEDAAWRGADVLWGQAQEYGAQTPYAPLVGALRAYLSPIRTQQLATVLDSLWLSLLARLIPELHSWLPDLASPPAVEPGQEQLRLLEGLVRSLLALDTRAPVLLVLEDLHWADASTYEALTYLARRLAHRRILLVVSYRSDDARSQPEVWQALQTIDQAGVLQRIQLATLTQDETEELVRRSLQVADRIRLFSARLFQATQGNPLFVRETLAALQADGTLTRDDQGHWRTPVDAATVDYSELALSPTMERTIANRLDRLAPAARTVLSAAAVLGGEMALPTLHGLVDMEGRQFLPLLGSLVEQRLLEETPTAYRFRHDKVQQTVYETIPATTRRDLHRRTAQLLAQDTIRALC